MTESSFRNHFVCLYSHCCSDRTSASASMKNPNHDKTLTDVAKTVLISTLMQVSEMGVPFLNFFF